MLFFIPLWDPSMSDKEADPSKMFILVSMAQISPHTTDWISVRVMNSV